MGATSLKRSVVFFLILALGLAMSFAFSTGDVSAAAKAKKITIKASAKTVKVGDKVKVKVTKVTPKKASKAVKWKITKGAKYARLTSKKGTSVVVVGKKPGTVTLKATAKKGKASCTIKIKVKARPQPEETVLLPFTLAGTYAKDKINYVDIAKDAVVKVLDIDKGTYVISSNEKDVIYGNFAKMIDKNADAKADEILVVGRADSAKCWDKDMVWMKGVQQGPDQPLDDDYAMEVYGKEQRIPFGQRQLEEFGVTDHSGTTDFLDLPGSPYWTHNDYYHMKSGGTLTMLEGYKTQSQSTGWDGVMTSAVTVLDWYGLREDLNERDLSALRGADRDQLFGDTSLEELETMYDTLTDMGIGKWNYVDSNNSDPDTTFRDPAWIKQQLSQGHPIQVIWNVIGPHGQVIIGFDDRGTPEIADDQVILADPYDKTDHQNDGYVVQSYARLIWGVLTQDESVDGTKFMAVWPDDAKKYTPSEGAGPVNENNHLEVTKNGEKLNGKLFGADGVNGPTQADIQKYYKNLVDEGLVVLYSNGLSGPALPPEEVDRWIEHDKSAYYFFRDYYNYKNGEPGELPGTLKMVEQFKTIQQATEYTCGVTAALMVIEHFGRNGTDEQPLETEISLCSKRQDGELGTTYLKGMVDIFETMNQDHQQTWVTLDKRDLKDPEGQWSTIRGRSGREYALQGSSANHGLIPYLIENGVPIMVGSDEWGGHWQTIVGYDDSGTTRPQDDVLILADPYDSTDHAQDGYFVKDFERLVNGWGCAFEDWEETTKWGLGKDGITNDFVVAIPRGYSDRTDAVIEELNMQ